MKPRIEILPEKKLAGIRITISFSRNRTQELWRKFMPIRKEIGNSIGSNLYSVEIYDQTFFENFNTETEFEKWAAVEVSDYEQIKKESPDHPVNIEFITIPSGLYAVFIHKGSAKEALKTYEYIFKEWLPNSEYSLDYRPHLAIMGEKYKNQDPNSEEEIWIPIKLRIE